MVPRTGDHDLVQSGRRPERWVRYSTHFVVNLAVRITSEFA
jgi:hypothetical protein